MTTKKTSSEGTTADFPAAEPFVAAQHAVSQTQQFWAAWGKHAYEQIASWDKAVRELGGWQDQGVRKVEESAEEAAKLFKASIGYMNELAGQAQTMTIEAAKRTVDLMSSNGR
jgi:hypothetical protein